MTSATTSTEKNYCDLDGCEGTLSADGEDWRGKWFKQRQKVIRLDRFRCGTCSTVWFLVKHRES